MCVRGGIIRLSHLDLSLHGEYEEYDEVHDENRPEYWYVEKLEERADKGDHYALRCRVPTRSHTYKRSKHYANVPEFELGQPSHEWPEFLILLCR